MDGKPEWVPEWLWTGYQEERNWLTKRIKTYRHGQFGPRLLERMDVMVGSRECAPIWKSLSPRVARLIEIDKVLSFGPNTVRTDGILLSIAFNAEGIPADEMLTAAERKRKGLAVAAITRKLRTAVIAMTSNRELPPAFTSSLRRVADKERASLVADNRAFWLPDGLSPECIEACTTSYWFGMLETINRWPKTLKAIERAALAFAESSPPVARPASPDAGRLHFIRETTGLMRLHFGTPLREHVATLTRVLFDCEMNAATVTKLAP